LATYCAKCGFLVTPHGSTDSRAGLQAHTPFGAFPICTSCLISGGPLIHPDCEGSAGVTLILAGVFGSAVLVAVVRAVFF